VLEYMMRIPNFWEAFWMLVLVITPFASLAAALTVYAWLPLPVCCVAVSPGIGFIALFGLIRLLVWFDDVRHSRNDPMGWVNDAKAELLAGRTVQVRPFGGSMRGRIESGQLVTLAPVSPANVRVDDAVLVEWRGNYLLHLVKEIQGDQLLIGNNLGKVNGWVSSTAVIGKVVAIQPQD
jgi:hypothetical protein